MRSSMQWHDHSVRVLGKTTPASVLQIDVTDVAARTSDWVTAKGGFDTSLAAIYSIFWKAENDDRVTALAEFATALGTPDVVQLQTRWNSHSRSAWHRHLTGSG